MAARSTGVRSGRRSRSPVSFGLTTKSQAPLFELVTFAVPAHWAARNPDAGADRRTHADTSANTGALAPRACGGVAKNGHTLDTTRARCPIDGRACGY